MNQATKILQTMMNNGIDNRVKHVRSTVSPKKPVLSPPVIKPVKPVKPRDFTKPKVGV